MYVDLQQFAAILLPRESAIFFPVGNFRGKTLENSGKQNPETGFKPPRAEHKTCHILAFLTGETSSFKWLAISNLLE